jgi:hypothetical protein
MRKLVILLPLFPVVLLGGVRAQSNAGCPARPQTLVQMRECYRPLLVFAPSAGDARLAAQREALDSAADDMMDRDVLLVPVLVGGAGGFVAPLDAPYVVLGAAEMADVRRRFGVAAGSFRVVLLGKDGGVKLRSSEPLAVDRLDSLIDGMPMRRLEMQRGHTH